MENEVEDAPVDGEVRAVMTSANSGGPWGWGKLVAKECERAMSEAVTKALADGVPISDSDEIRSRMLVARQDVLNRVKAPLQK